MKKFLLLVAFVLIFVALGFKEQGLLQLGHRYPNMQVVFYTRQNSPKNIKSIDSGVFTQIICGAQDALKIKKSIKEIDGISISFEGGIEDLEYIKDYYNVKIIIEEKIDNILCIYGYSDLINAEAVKINNEYINIQLTLRKNTVTAGMPIILGDY